MKNIYNSKENEKPTNPIIVKHIEIITTYFVLIFLTTLGANKADKVVNIIIVIATKLIVDDSTFNEEDMLGRPAPNKESGNPKDIKQRYITKSNNVTIL